MQVLSFKWIGAVMLVAGLAACGGGGDEAGDVDSMTILPSGFTWKSDTCPAGVTDAVTVHTINGGRSPFRIRSTVQGLEVGLTNANNEFVAASKNAEGDLVLDGRDPKFSIRANLPCESDVSVTVLDNYSNSASVSIKVEASGTTTTE